MLKTTFAKLLFSMMLLITIVTVLLLIYLQYSHHQNQKLANQNLHLDLADSLIYNLGFWEASIDEKKAVLDKEAVQRAFNMMMALGPSLELYVLDSEGQVIAYGEPSSLQTMQIPMAPIRTYLQNKKEGELTRAVTGLDPKSGREKVFSAASFDDDFPGYLYIIIGSKKYDEVWQGIDSGQNQINVLLSIFLIMTSLSILSLIVFWWITRPLNYLSLLMEGYEHKGEIDQALARKIQGHDIGGLARQFTHMAATIKQQLQNLHSLDESRQKLMMQISHDLRTPLSSQQAWLETLQLTQQELSLEEQHYYLEQAIESGDILNNRIDDIMQLARLQTAKEPINNIRFDMVKLCSSLIDSMQSLVLNKKVQLDFICQHDVFWVTADQKKIQRVLINLIENAVRYAFLNGVVALKLKQSENNKNLLISVCDNGKGIAEKNQQKIFEPYFKGECQDKKQGGNSGLGLAICQSIVQLHNAELSVQSKEGEGTCFSFSLPLILVNQTFGKATSHEYFEKEQETGSH